MLKGKSSTNIQQFSSISTLFDVSHINFCEQKNKKIKKQKKKKFTKALNLKVKSVLVLIKIRFVVKSFKFSNFLFYFISFENRQKKNETIMGGKFLTFLLI